MNKIEKKFYKTFGIEPKNYYGCNWDGYCPYDNEADECGGHCPYWSKYKNDYPKITDRILLELIGILNEFSYSHLNFHKYSEAQDEILQMCIDILDEEKHHYNEIVEQIQSLFREQEG